MASIPVNHEVAEALISGHPLVALESAAITHGLPRDPLPKTSKIKVPGWDQAGPTNLELARALHRAVREAGALPAMVAVIDGHLRVGLDDSELVMLALDSSAGKASSADLAPIMSRGGNAGTTVSATLAACALTHQDALARSKGLLRRANAQALPGIRVFATGGVGGVHRGWQKNLDISADLRALGSTKACVVCSGAKSILDLPATLEALQTLGVPVIGYRTNLFPQFHCTGSEQIRLSQRIESAQEAARICMTNWSALRMQTGIVLANPVPAEFAMNESEMEAAIQEADRLAHAQNVSGPALTPFLLAQVGRLTNHRAIDSNLALLIQNARLAAEISVALSAMTTLGAG